MQHKYNLLFFFALTFLVLGIHGTASETPSAPPVEHYYERTNQVLPKNYHYYVNGTMTAGQMFSVYWETCNESVEIDFYLMNPTNYNNWKSGKSYTAPINIQDTHVDSVSLLIPSTGVWYFVFANQYNGNMSFDFVIDYGESSVPEYSSDDGDDYENGQILEPNQYYFVSYNAMYGDILSGSMQVYFEDDMIDVAILTESAYNQWLEYMDVTTEMVETDQNSLYFEHEFTTGGDYYLLFYNAGNETVTFSFFSIMEHGPKFYTVLSIGIVGGIVGIVIIALLARRKPGHSPKARVMPVANASTVSPSYAPIGPRDQIPPARAVETPMPPVVNVPPAPAGNVPSVPVVNTPPPVVKASPKPAVKLPSVPAVPPSPEPVNTIPIAPPVIVDPSEIKALEGMPCSGCGALLRSGFYICPNCGTMNTLPTNSSPSEPIKLVEIPLEPIKPFVIAPEPIRPAMIASEPIKPAIIASEPIKPAKIASEPITPPQPSPEVPKFCGKCGMHLEPDMRFCPKCGSMTSPPSTQNIAPVPQPIAPPPKVAEPILPPQTLAEPIMPPPIPAELIAQSSIPPEVRVFCDKCGMRLETDALFCPKCGTMPSTLSISNAQTSSEGSALCGKCGWRLAADMLFCPKCGTKNLKKFA